MTGHQLVVPIHRARAATPVLLLLAWSAVGALSLSLVSAPIGLSVAALLFVFTRWVRWYARSELRVQLDPDGKRARFGEHWFELEGVLSVVPQRERWGYAVVLDQGRGRSDRVAAGLTREMAEWLTLELAAVGGTHAEVPEVSHKRLNPATYDEPPSWHMLRDETGKQAASALSGATTKGAPDAVPRSARCSRHMAVRHRAQPQTATRRAVPLAVQDTEQDVEVGQVGVPARPRLRH